jgi:hypothetical protein
MALAISDAFHLAYRIRSSTSSPASSPKTRRTSRNCAAMKKNLAVFLQNIKQVSHMIGILCGLASAVFVVGGKENLQGELEDMLLPRLVVLHRILLDQGLLLLHQLSVYIKHSPINTAPSSSRRAIRKPSFT